jgi:hypothetical protein
MVDTGKRSGMESYSVRVETRAPKDVLDTATDDAVDELMDLLEPYDAVVAAGPVSWAATVTVVAENSRNAIERGSQLIEKMAAKAGLPSWPTVRVEAIRQDVLAELLAHPLLPELVSAPEAADILGVSTQRVHQIAAENMDFPQPAYELRAGKLWLRAAVQAFAERKRLPGRPRRAAFAV